MLGLAGGFESTCSRFVYYSPVWYGYHDACCRSGTNTCFMILAAAASRSRMQSSVKCTGQYLRIYCDQMMRWARVLSRSNVYTSTRRYYGLHQRYCELYCHQQLHLSTEHMTHDGSRGAEPAAESRGIQDNLGTSRAIDWMVTGRLGHAWKYYLCIRVCTSK